jgi:hypothetical protein
MLDRTNEINSLQAELSGVNRQMEEYRQNQVNLRGLDFEIYLQRSAIAFDDETEALKANTRQLDERARLLLEGVPEGDIERVLNRARTEEELADRLKIVNSAEALGIQTSERAAEARKVLTEAAEAQKRAYDDLAASTLREQVGGIFTGQVEQNRELEARIAALQQGRTELTEQEQVTLRLQTLGVDLNSQEAQRALNAAATTDELNRKVDVLNRQRELIQSIGSSIENDIVRGIDAAITGAESLRKVFAGVLKDIGQILIRTGVNSLLGGIQIGGTPLVPQRAAGGPVSGGSPYLIGENGPEFFIPGVSGRVVSNADTRDYIDDVLDDYGDTTGDDDGDSFSDTRAAVEGGMALTNAQNRESIARVFASTRSMTASAVNNMRERQVERERQTAAEMMVQVGSSVKLDTVVIDRIGEVATVDQVRTAMMQAAKEGAKRGQAMVLRDMKNSPSFRKKMV